MYPQDQPFLQRGVRNSIRGFRFGWFSFQVTNIVLGEMRWAVTGEAQQRQKSFCEAGLGLLYWLKHFVLFLTAWVSHEAETRSNSLNISKPLTNPWFPSLKPKFYLVPLLWAWGGEVIADGT